MYPNVRNKKDCLHCGNETADYCEKCYQDLISKNATLQREIYKQKQYIKDLKNVKRFKMHDYKIRKGDNGKIIFKEERGIK